MIKIQNDMRFNTYGLNGMKSKYIYMKRSYTEYEIHYIYLIDSILVDKFPQKYKCKRLYIYNSPKLNNKVSFVTDNTDILELTNNDTLYEISFEEYLKIFKEFVRCSGTKNKLDI